MLTVLEKIKLGKYFSKLPLTDKLRRADNERLFALFRTEVVAEVFGADASDWGNVIDCWLNGIEAEGGTLESMFYQVYARFPQLEAIKADHAKLMQVAHQKWYERNFQPWVEMAHKQPTEE